MDCPAGAGGARDLGGRAACAGRVRLRLRSGIAKNNGVLRRDRQVLAHMFVQLGYVVGVKVKPKPLAQDTFKITLGNVERFMHKVRLINNTVTSFQRE